MSLLLDALKAAAKEKEHKASLDANTANESRGNHVGSNPNKTTHTKFTLPHSDSESNSVQSADHVAANSDLPLEDLITDLDLEAVGSSTELTAESTSIDAPASTSQASELELEIDLELELEGELLPESFSLEPSAEESPGQKDNEIPSRVEKESSSPLEDEPFTDSVDQLQETLKTLTQTVDLKSKLQLTDEGLDEQAVDPFNLFNDDSLYENEIAESEQAALEPEQELRLEVSDIEPTPSDQTTKTNGISDSDLFEEFGISADEIAAATPEPALAPEQTNAPTAKVSSYDPLEILVKSGRKEAKRNRHLMQGAFAISILMIFVSGYYFYTQMATEYQPPSIAMNQAPEPLVRLADEAQTLLINKVAIDTAENKNDTSEVPSTNNSNNQPKSNQKHNSPQAAIPQKEKDLMNNKWAAMPSADKNINANNAVNKIEKKDKKPKVKSKSIAKPIAKPAAKNRPTRLVKKSAPAPKKKAEISAQSIGDLNNQAYALFHQREYREALNLYDQVLAHQPRNRDGLLGKAAIALINSDPDQASQLYKTLLNLNPKDFTARAALTSIHQNSNPPLNHADLLFQIRENPQSHALHFALGNLYASTQNWQGAQDAYFNAWSIEANSADYCYNLALSLDQLNKPKHALKLYRKSLLLAQSYHSNFSQQLVKERIDQLNNRLGIAQWERVIER